MVDRAQILALQRQLSGKILFPTQSDYKSVLEIDNGRVEAFPSFIVQVDGVEDIATVLRFARQHGLRFTVKGGGHSASGYCLNSEGIVIDMSAMRAIRLDAEQRTVTVQMGARWQEVYVHLMNSGTGLIPIGGGCPTVGVAGFMQGGGYSFVSRSYGMSVDNLLSVTIVLADGCVRRVGPDSQGEDAELFWALRGGGGGNWGVAVEMCLRVHQPNTPKMLTAQLRFTPDRAQQVLGFYNDWVETLPDQLAVYGIWGMSPDPADSTKQIETFGFTAIYNGDLGEGMTLLAPLLAHGPLTASINALTLPEFELINGRSTLVDHRSAYIRAGVMPPRAFTPEAIAVFSKYMASAPSSGTFLVWTHGGGQIEKVPVDATAFFHRHGRFIPELKAIWDSPDQARANVEWAYAFFRDLEPHFQGSYVNYIDPLLPGWPQKYYGSHVDRLRRIKAMVDPKGAFDFQQSVNSTFEPSTAQPLDLAPLNRTFVTG